MKPEDSYTNGDGRDGSEDESGGSEEELSLVDEGHAARALHALNALRKSRQHYDVVVEGEGLELPAHRAVLAAVSPRLLAALPAPAPAPAPCPATYRVEGVAGAALREMVEYAYTGRLRVESAAAARALYQAAWRLRVEPARAHLAARLVRRLEPADCLAVRALPGLAPEHRDHVDAFITEHFERLCSTGALAALPIIRIEMLRESSADDGEESPPDVAAAALSWLRSQLEGDQRLEEVCSRAHLLYVDAEGALRDCGELPAARGSDAPELTEYRRAAAERAARPGLAAEPLAQRHDWAVLAARRLGPRATRALVALGGQLAVAHVAWRAVSGQVPRGAPLPAAAPEPGEGETRAALARGRCAHGTAALGGRLLVLGGYDRAEALRSAESYDPGSNTWSALPDMRGPRARFPAARLGECVYALGGSDGHAELDSVDCLAAGAWVARARLPLARSHAAAAADEARGELYVVGGWNAGVSLKAVHKYSPATNSWSEAPPLNVGRSQLAGVVWRDALWALGGCDAWHCLASTETLPLGEPGAAWTQGPALPTARRSVGGAVWRGLLVSAGGSDGAASLRRTDMLQAGAERWLAGPELRVARAALGLAVLHDVLYAVGGFSGKEFLGGVECLHELGGEWTVLRDPKPPRHLKLSPTDVSKLQELALQEAPREGERGAGEQRAA